MDSEQEKLNSLLQRLGDPAAPPLSEEETLWLEDFKSRYPFFTLPGAAREEQPSLREVVTAPSREALARMKGREEASRFDNFYPPCKGGATPTTSAAIDDFLNTYGHQSQEENQLLERLIFNPVPDYAQQLAREEEANLPELPSGPDACGADGQGHPLSAQERLDRFILTHREGGLPRQALPPEEPAAHAPRKTAPPTPPDGLLSESLAKIYIKTHRYEQAYEILNGLSLRFPEKSRYFADQLRFLRKLILNQQRSRVENQSDDNSNP